MAQVAEREKTKEKVISFDEFIELVNSSSWERSQRIEVVNWFIVKRWRPELFKFEYVIRVEGEAVKFNKLDDIEIIYAETWTYDKNDPSSLTIIPYTDASKSWFINIKVIYDNDEEVTTYALTRVLPDEFSAIDYNIILKKGDGTWHT